MCEVGAMVLAAGTSERMDGPTPKQLLMLRGKTIVANTVRAVEGSEVDRIVVVTGHRADDVAAAVAGGRAEVVFNPDYRSGNMSSFRTAAAALAACDAVVFLLADMPGVTTAIVDALIAEWRRSRPWAARSIYTDGPAHPLLLSAAALRAAARAEGAHGVWRLLDDAPEGKVAEIHFSMPTPTDVNTRADYERLLRAQEES